MARNYIKVDTTVVTATHAVKLKQLVAAIRQTFDLATEIESIMSHNHDGVVYSDIEILFGLPTGQGATVYTLIADGLETFKGNVQSNAAKTIMERIG